ncbi:cell wall-binding repeat-containing protein [Paenactinomyces guangxiensis]|uniref:Cell wall-binding repeat-containing protein n=1 Tax=Paenactinomyces guangxiensis TaxID=1490290 RepID=A0A7W1WQS0_9BACL|nr:cell wall-binding repeat-containing protein [Paenactinomyces guangxiensis]MBA4494156.1 cell wall-binding repeat-containing protein [Paenactinomyces guangxiensis]MBH8591099.1 cell wall-binding repeat-containing protein [Paenactinomyces guangxiensis]
MSFKGKAGLIIAAGVAAAAVFSLPIVPSSWAKATVVKPMTGLVRHQLQEDYQGTPQNIRFQNEAKQAVLTVDANEEGYFTSKAIKSRFPFNYFAVEWRNRSANKKEARKLIKVEVRTSVDGKKWTAWQAAEPDEFSHPGQEEVYSNLVFADRANYVQYRVELEGKAKVQPRVKDIRIFFVNSRDGKKVEEKKSVWETLFDSAEAAVNKPNVVSRANWGADESLRYDSNNQEVWPREYRTVTHMVVHHSATSNSDTDYESTIRAIYAFHAKPKDQGGRGWGDIAYNALIAPNGTIYEGRKGKDGDILTEGVVGGHAYSFNYGTFGVSMIGNYNEKPLASQARASLVKLLAYEAGYWNIDPTAKKDFVRNYEYNDPNVPKVDYNLPTLTGHGLLPRASTSCPGAYIKPELQNGNLAADVKQAMQTSENVKRLDGANRFAVSANVSKEIDSLGSASDTVVIARGDLYTDALSGGPLAGKTDSPILLTSTSSLPMEIKEEITRRKPAKAIILGGTGSVSTDVESQLKSLGVNTVERIDGPNRFAVSASVAEKVMTESTNDTAIIASGLTFPDALSVSGVAGKNGMPILLVSTDKIPAEIQSFIDKHPEITKYVIVGGPATVSDTVKTSLANSGKSVTRISGANRFEVGVNIANYFNLNPATTVFARGDNFADALSGGPLASATGAPILLTPSTRLDSSVESYLQTHQAKLDKAYILGGVYSVSPEVEYKISSYVQ